MNDFVSLETALERKLDQPLEHLAAELRTQIAAILPAPSVWNRLSPKQRREAARQWDSWQERARELFNEVRWPPERAVLWIMYCDRSINEKNARRIAWYKNRAPIISNPGKTLVVALRNEKICAFTKKAKRLPANFWDTESGRTWPRGVTLRREDVLALWPDRATRSAGPPSDAMHADAFTGERKKTWLAERRFRELRESKNVNGKSARAQAQELWDWQKREFPNEPRPSPETIRKAIGPMWRETRSGCYRAAE